MTCTACGDAPKKGCGCKSCTKAVLEITNPEKIVLLRKVVIPASMGDDTVVKPTLGKYCNVILYYEANRHIYLYSSDGIPTALESEVPQDIVDRIEDLEGEDIRLWSAVNEVEGALETEETTRANADTQLSNAIAGEAQARETAITNEAQARTNAIAAETTARENADTNLQNAISDEVTARQTADTNLQTAINTAVQNEAQARTSAISAEATARQTADNGLQTQIDAIVAGSDVKDIVGTYAQLQAYDTSTLGDRDIIKVLQDETHLDETTYYRWSTSTQTFTLIGEEGPYYTKAATNALLDTKQDELTAGDNITMADESGSLVISATDTTYTAGYGLELNDTEFSVDPDIVQDTLTAGDNITIEDESGSLVISAADSLSPTTTFWGQTANNGVVDGQLTITSNGGLPTMKVGGGFIDTESSAPFYIRALKSGSTYSNVFWWNSASNHVPSDVHIDAANAHLVLRDNGVLDLRNDANGPLTVSGVKDPQSANDAATKGYVDAAVNTIDTALDAKQDELTAGNGISITDESGALVISATGAQIATINAQDWSSLWQ